MKLLQRIATWALIVTVSEVVVWLVAPGWLGAGIVFVYNLPPFGAAWRLVKTYE